MSLTELQRDIATKHFMLRQHLEGLQARDSSPENNHSLQLVLELGELLVRALQPEAVSVVADIPNANALTPSPVIEDFDVPQASDEYAIPPRKAWEESMAYVDCGTDPRALVNWLRDPKNAGKPVSFSGTSSAIEFGRTGWGIQVPKGAYRIVGLPDATGAPATIQGVSLQGQVSVSIRNATIQAQKGAQAAVLVFTKTTENYLQLYDVDLKGDAPYGRGHWQGHGYMWAIRGHGQCRYDLRNVTAESPQEHFFYVDNVVGPTYLQKLVGGEFSWRTMIQITNRAISGPPGSGLIVIEDVVACNIGGGPNGGEGGSDFTIAGHTGIVVLRRCKSLGSPERSQGALAVWTDSGRHGLIPATVEGRQYSTTKVVLDDFEAVHPAGDRSILAISGAAEVYMNGVRTSGPNTHLALETPFSMEPRENGEIRLGDYRPESIRYRGRDHKFEEIFTPKGAMHD